MLSDMPDTLHMDGDSFRSDLARIAVEAGIKLRVPVVRAVVQALSEKDDTAEVYLNCKGNPVADSKLRDHERVPLFASDDPVDQRGVPASVQEFFDRQVRPYRPDAWINESRWTGKTDTWAMRSISIGTSTDSALHVHLGRLSGTSLRSPTKSSRC